MDKQDLLKFLEDNQKPNLCRLFKELDYAPMVVEIIPSGVRMDFLCEKEEDDKVLSLEFIGDEALADVFLCSCDLKTKQYVMTILKENEVRFFLKKFFDRDYKDFEYFIKRNEAETTLVVIHKDYVKNELVPCFNGNGRILLAVLERDIPFVVTLSDNCFVNVYAFVKTNQVDKCENVKDRNAEITLQENYDIKDKNIIQFHKAFEDNGIELAPTYDYIIGWDFEHFGDYYDTKFLEDLEEIADRTDLALNKTLWNIKKNRLPDFNEYSLMIDWRYLDRFIKDLAMAMSGYLDEIVKILEEIKKETKDGEQNSK